MREQKVCVLNGAGLPRCGYFIVIEKTCGALIAWISLMFFDTLYLRYEDCSSL
jgi:hypothetical protein